MALNYYPVLLVLAILGAIALHGGAQRYPQTQRQQQTTFQQFRANAEQTAQVRNSVFTCPEPYGNYPNPGQCDAYYKCVEGVATEELCPDGLLFDGTAHPFSFPCQYPKDVNCHGRSSLQPAQPTEQCPHQYGYFRLGDSVNCGQFVNCAAGRGFVVDCPDGLAFDERTYHCDWPDKVPTCDAEGYLGFRCPEESRFFKQGEPEFRYFRSPNDCQKYFICVDGRPRRYNCQDGEAFNDLIGSCDGVENVTGCGIPTSKSSNQLDNGFNYYRG